MQRNYIIFSSSSYQYLHEELCGVDGLTRGEIQREEFPDGERYLRICSPIENEHVILIGGTINETETLEIYDLACALVQYGARSLTIFLPYFGYSTMERAIRWGEVVTAKNRARLFSSVPQASFGNRVICLDLHSEGLPHYFESSLRPVHLYCKSVIQREIKSAGGEEFVIGCTDAGRAKWVQSLANDMGCSASFVFKRRLSGEKTEVTAVSAHVSGKNVVIFDDIVRTGGSLIESAKAYAAAGAKDITAVVTHGVLPANSLERIKKSGIIKGLICTNSHPQAQRLQDGYLSVCSIAPVFADFLEGTGNAMY